MRPWPSAPQQPDRRTRHFRSKRSPDLRCLTRARADGCDLFSLRARSRDAATGQPHSPQVRRWYAFGAAELVSAIRAAHHRSRWDRGRTIDGFRGAARGHCVGAPHAYRAAWLHAAARARGGRQVRDVYRRCHLLDWQPWSEPRDLGSICTVQPPCGIHPPAASAVRGKVIKHEIGAACRSGLAAAWTRRTRKPLIGSNCD